MSAVTLAVVMSVSFFLCSGQIRSSERKEILNKLQAIQATVDDTRDVLKKIQRDVKDNKKRLRELEEIVKVNRNKSQSVPTDIRDLKVNVIENQNKLRTIYALVQTETLKLQNDYKFYIEICKSHLITPYLYKEQNATDIKPPFCDMETEGGGWIVIQRRVKGDLNFTRKWDDYKYGFGSLDGDYWIGNDVISKLTQTGYNELRIDMIYKEKAYYAVYKDVSVGNEAELYRLHLSFKKSNIKDSFSGHNRMAFSTHDKDNDLAWDANCGNNFRSGWWFSACLEVNLNGVWGGISDGVEWRNLTNYADSLESVQMKLRRP